MIEAKRSGAYFALPHSLLTGRDSGYVQVKTLLTDQSISEAINQVRTYCLDIGCDFGAITNGHTRIFFRTFQKGEDWKNLRAFVIASLEYFASSHRIEDALTPYLQQYGIQDFAAKQKGGKFGNRLAKNIRAGARTDVVILFGGKGVGKPFPHFMT